MRSWLVVRIFAVWTLLLTLALLGPVASASPGAVGTITKFPLPTPGSHPPGITSGPDGNLWFTEQAANKVSKVSADGANFTVTSNSDADHQGFCSPLGACTLRDAVNAANLQSGPDMIAFNILPGGVQTIQPTSPLPTVTDPVVIDGSTQRGASCPSTLLPWLHCRTSLAARPSSETRLREQLPQCVAVPDR